MRHPKVRAAVISAFWSAVLFYFIFTGFILATRWYLLPQVNRFKEPIAEAVGEAIGCRVEIGAVEPRWDTFWPRLSLRGVTLSRPDPDSGRTELLHLPEVEASLYWRSVLGKVRFKDLTIADARLSVQRLSEHVYDIAGFRLDLSPASGAGSGESGAAPSPALSRGLGWLLDQGRLSIIDSSITYIDRTDPSAEPTVFEKIDLTFEDQAVNYAFGLQAVLAGPGHNTLDLRAAFTTGIFDATDWRQWDGELYFEARGLDVARLVAPSEMLSSIVRRGHGDLRLWMDFSDARPVSASGGVTARNLRLDLPGSHAPLEIDALAARVKESLEGDNLTLEATDLSLALADGTRMGMPLAGFDVQLKPERLEALAARLRLGEIDLAALDRLSDALPLPENILKAVTERAPTGVLRETTVSWRGADAAQGGREPRSWSVTSAFDNITVAAVKADPKAGRPMTPGVGKLSGTLQLSSAGGRVTLDTRAGSLTFPGIFENPTIALDTLTGEVFWEIKENRPVVHVQNVHAVNDDADVTVRGSWRADPAAGPAGTANLTGTIARGRAAAVWRYIPLVVGEGVRDWLQEGLVEGVAHDGVFEVRGPLNKFPWSTAGGAKSDSAPQGRFMVQARVSGAAIDYEPQKTRTPAKTWPLLTNIEGRLLFEGFSMRIEADRARTFGVDVGPTSAEIKQLNAGRDTLLSINGSAQGQLQKFFDYVEASPVGGFVQHAFKGTRASGDARLSLKLDIPLLHARDTRVAGGITMAGNRVDMPRPIPPLSEVTGTVNFTEKGASAKNVLAKPFAGEDASVNVVTSADGTISITAAGAVNVADINYFAPTPVVADILSHARGTTPFVATTTISRKTGVTITAQSSLQGVSLDLPAPMNKSAQQSWPLRFSASPVSIRREPGVMISVDAGSRFDVLVQLPAGTVDGRASRLPVRGAVSIGTRSGLPAEGFSLAVHTPRLSLPEWSAPLRSLINAASGGRKSAAEDPALEAARAEQIAAALTRVSADVKEAVFTDSSLQNLTVDYAKNAGSWNLSVASDRIAGSVHYSSAAEGLLSLDMKRLSLSKNAVKVLKEFIEGPEAQNADGAAGTGSKPAVAAAHPRHLPRISARIGELAYDGIKLGAAQLQTSVDRQGAAEGLHIDRATLSSPSGQLHAQGNWTRSFAAGAPDKTSLNLSWNIQNMGGLLSELGFPGVIQNAGGQAAARLSFEGSPWSPRMDTLAGDLSIDFSKGSFIEVKTGPAGTLLSLLSFQSLLKRLTLDFSDLVQEGFSFDRFTGTATIDKGVTVTDNTKVVGAQATVLISGAVDLARQRLNTHAVVLPDLNAGNASLALAFVNPAVGIGSFLAQLLLRDPLSRIFKVEYDITGSFDDPVITKVGEDKPQAGSGRRS